MRAASSPSTVCRLRRGAAYLQAFEAGRLQALTRLSISAHYAAFHVGLVFAGLRSTAFCYLWFKSGFIPRVLAGWGVFASVLMGAFAFAFIIVPELAKVVTVAIYGGPIFLFELTMGFWLLLRLPDNGSCRVATQCAHAQLLLDLIAEDRQLNVYAGELESAPTTVRCWRVVDPGDGLPVRSDVTDPFADNLMNIATFAKARAAA